MDNNTLIKEFTDKIIKGDESSDDSIKQIIINKTKALINSWKNEGISEAVGANTHGIVLNGEDVLVKNKLVGRATVDRNGVNYTTADGRFSKEFRSIKDLYTYLVDLYSPKANAFGVRENKMEDLGTKIDVPKEMDFEGKETLVKQDGTENCDVDGKANADKKSETKDKFDPDAETAPPAGKKLSKLKNLIADIKQGNRKTSSSDSLVENKKNWNMDNKDVDGEGKASKLKAKVKKIKDIADKQGAKE